MGDADNELLSNYDINKENIKIKNTRELEYIRKSKQEATGYSFLQNLYKDRSFAKL